MALLSQDLLLFFPSLLQAESISVNPYNVTGVDFFSIGLDSYLVFSRDLDTYGIGEKSIIYLWSATSEYKINFDSAENFRLEPKLYWLNWFKINLALSIFRKANPTHFITLKKQNLIKKFLQQFGYENISYIKISCILC